MSILGADGNPVEVPPQPFPYSQSELKEMAKFEQFPSKITALAGVEPGNPPHKLTDNQKRYPRMLYKAQRDPDQGGKWAVFREVPNQYGFRDPQEWQRAVASAEYFGRSCQMTVNSEDEHARAKAQGWSDSSIEAMEYVTAERAAIGEIAAQRAYEDRNLSENAKAEAAAAESEHFGHLPAIPEKPKARRGRPPKNKPQEPA